MLNSICKNALGFIYNLKTLFCVIIRILYSRIRFLIFDDRIESLFIIVYFDRNQQKYPIDNMNILIGR